MLYFKIIVLLPPLLDGCTAHLKKATLLLTFFADSQIEIDTDDGMDEGTNEGSDVDQDEDDLPDVEEVRYDVTVVVLIVS